MIVLIIILAIFLGWYYKKYHEFDEVFPRTLLMTAVVYFVISTLYIIISYNELATLKEKRTKIVIVDKDKYTIYQVSDWVRNDDSRNVTFGY